jgi:PTH1 family peptidyl-tRNA hydrolase
MNERIGALESAPSPQLDQRWLIVGLGNPGPKYAGNRHNIGFMAVDQLARAAKLSGWQQSARFNGELLLGHIGKHAAVLLKPQTYMNLSGESVEPVAHFYRVCCERLIVVHDDVDLELGRLKLKRGGGDGGQKGVRSIARLLGDPEFIRIRLGIGRPRAGDVADYVLTDFSQDEGETRDEVISRTISAMRVVMSRGLEEAMNRFNRPPPKPARKPADESPTNKSFANKSPANEADQH